MSLRLDHISKSYGSVEVLKGITCELRRGEIVGLLGQNGAGKTTLLKILAGLTSEYTGTVTLDNQSGDYKQQIGYMSERNPLYPDMYVSEYLSWIASCHNQNDKGKLNQLIERAGLSSMRHKQIKELSKGYRQRVGLAAALIHDPAVLILDEPINGLDPAQILQYRALIKSVADDKIIILSSHLMQEIQAICTRYLLIEGGTIAQDELLEQEAVTTQRLLLKTVGADISTQLRELPGVLSYTYRKDDTYDIVIDTDADPRLSLQQEIVNQGGYIVSLVPQTKDLDRLFTNNTEG